jgi:hypothetical protein
MDTGVSLDDDLARFQVITKNTYPSLASQKNKMDKVIILIGMLGKQLVVLYKPLVEV